MIKQSLKFGHKKLYVDGQLIEASNGETFEVICPANEKPIASISWADKLDTERALETAQKGFGSWSQLPLEERLQWIEKLRKKLLENSDLLRESIM